MIRPDHWLIQTDIQFIHLSRVALLTVVTFSSLYSFIWDLETSTARLSDLGLQWPLISAHLVKDWWFARQCRVWHVEVLSACPHAWVLCGFVCFRWLSCQCCWFWPVAYSGLNRTGPINQRRLFLIRILNLVLSLKLLNKLHKLILLLRPHHHLIEIINLDLN